MRSPASPPGARRPALTTRATALGLVLCALVLALAYPMQRYLAQRGQVAAVTAQQAATRARIAVLRRRLAQWENPAYVEQQARERLHYTLPGQGLYLVVGAAPGSAGVLRQGRASVPSDSTAPWYSQLWSSDLAAGR